MTTPLVALLGFAAWTLALVLTLVTSRVIPILARKKAANAFVADEPHGPPWYRRLTRAHANCVENLPVFGAVVLVAAVSTYRSDTFDTLALVVLGARVAQSLVHVASGGPLATMIRFTFYATQIAAVITMGIGVARHLLG